RVIAAHVRRASDGRLDPLVLGIAAELVVVVNLLDPGVILDARGVVAAEVHLTEERRHALRRDRAVGVARRRPLVARSGIRVDAIVPPATGDRREAVKAVAAGRPQRRSVPLAAEELVLPVSLSRREQ